MTSQVSKATGGCYIIEVRFCLKIIEEKKASNEKSDQFVGDPIRVMDDNPEVQIQI